MEYIKFGTCVFEGENILTLFMLIKNNINIELGSSSAGKNKVSGGGLNLERDFSIVYDTSSGQFVSLVKPRSSVPLDVERAVLINRKTMRITREKERESVTKQLDIVLYSSLGKERQYSYFTKPLLDLFYACLVSIKLVNSECVLNLGFFCDEHNPPLAMFICKLSQVMDIHKLSILKGVNDTGTSYSLESLLFFQTINYLYVEQGANISEEHLYEYLKRLHHLDGYEGPHLTGRVMAQLILLGVTNVRCGQRVIVDANVTNYLGQILSMQPPPYPIREKRYNYVTLLMNNVSNFSLIFKLAGGRRRDGGGGEGSVDLDILINPAGENNLRIGNGYHEYLKKSLLLLFQYVYPKVLLHENKIDFKENTPTLFMCYSILLGIGLVRMGLTCFKVSVMGQPLLLPEREAFQNLSEDTRSFTDILHFSFYKELIAYWGKGERLTCELEIEIPFLIELHSDVTRLYPKGETYMDQLNDWFLSPINSITYYSQLKYFFYLSYKEREVYLNQFKNWISICCEDDCKVFTEKNKNINMYNLYSVWSRFDASTIEKFENQMSSIMKNDDVYVRKGNMMASGKVVKHRELFLINKEFDDYGMPTFDIPRAFYFVQRHNTF